MVRTAGYATTVRIAVVAPPWLPVPPAGYGGTERVISLLVEGLVDRGHEVTLVAAPGSCTRARLVTPLDEPLALINASHEDAAYQSLAGLAAAGDVDLVHDHTALGPAFAAARGGGPPTVHTLHGRWTPATRRLLGATADHVHLVAISESQRRANPAVRYAGVVPNGIDLAAHPFRADKEEFLAFVGRISPEKGPEVAIDVARKAGLPLVMAIKCQEPEEWDYWEQVVAPRLGGDVHVLEQPPHDEKVALLGRARAVLCPIDWPEPFGLVFAEAAACGTPVITRPLGAAPEIVVHGTTGFLCTRDADMVEAVDAAGALDPYACRSHVEARFSADAMVSGYERLYSRLVTKAGRGNGMSSGPGCRDRNTARAHR